MVVNIYVSCVFVCDKDLLINFFVNDKIVYLMIEILEVILFVDIVGGFRIVEYCILYYFRFGVVWWVW